MENNIHLLKTVPFEWAEVTIHSIKYDKDFIAKIYKQDKRKYSAIKKNRQVKVSEEEIEDREQSTVQMEVDRTERRGFAWKHEPKLPPGASGEWKHRYLPTWRLYRGIEFFRLGMRRDEAAHTESEYDLDIIFARSLEHLWSGYSNELLTRVRTIQGKGLANILQTILAPTKAYRKLKQLDSKLAYQRVAAFLSRQGSKRMLGSLKQFEKKYNKEVQLQKAVSDIDLVEQQIEEVMASRNKLEQLIREMFSGNKTVIFKDASIEVKTDDQRNIGLTSLSSGEKHALWIFIETLLAEDNTLLIDEPELSLHVDWQTRLISGMQQLNRDAQLILATHSPEIMVDIPDNKIFRL
jgi:predicted ATPase